MRDRTLIKAEIKRIKKKLRKIVKAGLQVKKT